MLFDDPAALEPDEIVHWFEVCAAGLECEEREAHRQLGLQAELSPTLTEVLGFGAAREEISEYFKACRRELEISALLMLAASAEARLRLDASLRMHNQDGLGKRLKVLRGNARSEWMIPLYEDGIVDAWKAHIGSIDLPVRADRARLLASVGRFKNLLGVRHWVAHGRYWTIQRGIEHFPPDVAAGVVEDLYTALRAAARLEGLQSFA